MSTSDHSLKPEVNLDETQQAVRRPVDGGGVSGLACGSLGPARSTREEVADVHCGIGSWGFLGRPVSEHGTLCHGDADHGGGDRRRTLLMLAILLSRRNSYETSQA